MNEGNSPEHDLAARAKQAGGRLQLCEYLAAEGVPVAEIPTRVLRGIYPMHQRWWWSLRPFFGREPFTAEHELVADLLAARTLQEVDTALHYYHFSPPEHRALFMRPRARRVYRFVRRFLGRSAEEE